VTPPTVVGLDLSLTSTGVAILADPSPFLFTAAAGPSAKDVPSRLDRLATLASDIVERVAALERWPHLVVVEAPAFSRTTSQRHEGSGLWWLTVRELVAEYGLDVVEVSPTARARYAAGKGNASKDTVLAATIRRYPWADITGNDTADALVLAAMGRRWLGHPVEDSLPQTHLAAMSGVHWPEQVTP
jgi:crossover junction endodeoxyribonuclease RuvC